MNVKDVIDLIELRLARSGVTDVPKNLIKDVLRIKLREFAGNIDDVMYVLTTDGSREYELPSGMSRVEFVTVDDTEAICVSPEQGDRSYAESIDV